jgi:hypothetical protein
MALSPAVVGKNMQDFLFSPESDNQSLQHGNVMDFDSICGRHANFGGSRAKLGR